MKRTPRKALSLMLMVALMAMSATLTTGCSSEQHMFERKQTNKSATIKSNIKMRGTNKANGHTTRSY